MVLLFFLLVVATASANTAFGSTNIFSAIAREPPIQAQCKLANIVLVLSEQTVEYGLHVDFGFKPNVWGTTRYNWDFMWGNQSKSFDVCVDFWLSFWLKRLCLPFLWVVSEDGFFRQENGSGDQYLAYIWK